MIEILNKYCSQISADTFKLTRCSWNTLYFKVKDIHNIYCYIIIDDNNIGIGRFKSIQKLERFLNSLN